MTQGTVAEAQQKLASNPGLRGRVQKLRKKVAKARGEPEPKFKKPRGAIQQAAPGTRKLRNRGNVLNDLIQQTRGKP